MKIYVYACGCRSDVVGLITAKGRKRCPIHKKVIKNILRYCWQCGEEMNLTSVGGGNRKYCLKCQRGRQADAVRKCRAKEPVIYKREAERRLEAIAKTSGGRVVPEIHPTPVLDSILRGMGRKI